MLKNISNLGKMLSREELKSIQGSLSRPRPFIGSGCRARCPESCASLNGRCFPCDMSFGGGFGAPGFECRIFG